MYDARACDYVIPVMTVLDDIPALAITEQEAQKLRFGQTFNLDDDRSQMFLALASASDQTAPSQGWQLWQAAHSSCSLEKQIVSPVRVLNL